ncbi:uncharacterized protein LOC120068937, partial [Benincasa hispida]|uniref:uncharacterized protein LOC120068937 n=1 Tax=Benincasa hispida TaxID=102211 RepID=UPI0019001C3D
MTDNGRQFFNGLMNILCEKFKFKQYKSFMYNIAANGSYTILSCLWSKVVLPLEREIPSIRMAVQEGLTTEDNAKLRFQELKALDEKRLEAQQALECDDLVFAVKRPIITTRHMG